MTIVGKIKHLVDSEVDRMQSSAHDFDDMGSQLKALGSVNTGYASIGQWNKMQTGFTAISR